MEITLNGKTVDTESKTIESLLQEYDQDADAGGLAVAVNETVVPQTKWGEQTISNNDRVEVIRATQGG